MPWRRRATALAGFAGDVLVLYGDAPLVTTATLGALLAERRRAPEAAAAVLGMRPADPGAYGRLVTGPGGALEAIVEAAECTPAERAIPLCNSGPDGGRWAASLRAPRRHRQGQ